MKRFILLILILLSVTSAFAQTVKPFSNKESKEFIAQIKELISVGDFETAINVYHNNVDRIELKNIAKRDRAWWESTKANLDLKDSIFNNSATAVSAAKRLYSIQEYWQCNEAINALKLDGDNARMETLRKYNDLVGKMGEKRSFLKKVEEQMPEVIEHYEKKEYEHLFLTFFNGTMATAEENNESITAYINPAYLEKIESIVIECGPLYDRYYNTYMETYALPLKKNNTLPKVNDMRHNQAKECLAFFQSVVAAINKGSEFSAGEYPILAGKQKEMLDYATGAITALKKRVNETDPINAFFKQGTFTLEQIKEDCSEVDECLLSILSLDVNSYYHKSFSTELQADMYRESAEYKQNYKELQRLKNQALKTVFYSIMDVNTNKYSLEHGCFFIEIGSNKGTQSLFPGMKPKVNHSNEINGVVHESLTIASFTNAWVKAGYRNGDKFYEYCIKLPVSKSTAAKLENKKCKLVVCFVPAGVKTYKCMGADYDGRGSYDIFYANKTCPYSVKCHLFLFSQNGELLIDKII